MNRREALKQVALLMGGAVSAPAILGLLNGCGTAAAEARKPAFLTAEQHSLVADVAEIMIPRTDTPGAKDIGIADFIDSMLKDAYPREDQDRFIAGLNDLDRQAHEQYGSSFTKLDASKQAALVRTTHEAAVAVERSPAARGLLQRPFILMTKELTLLGYFTSRPGATQVLQYDPMPGPFRGCVDLSEAGNGKTWAGEASRRF